jgi:hypothetical protein
VQGCAPVWWACGLLGLVWSVNPGQVCDIYTETNCGLKKEEKKNKNNPPLNFTQNFNKILAPRN